MREGFETLKNCYELTTQAGTKIFAILRRDLKCYKMTLLKNVAGLQSQGHKRRKRAHREDFFLIFNVKESALK